MFENSELNCSTFYSTGETYKIKSHITCNTVTLNVIYMIQCRLCNLHGKANAALSVLMNIDALYLTHPVVTSKPQF